MTNREKKENKYQTKKKTSASKQATTTIKQMDEQQAYYLQHQQQTAQQGCAAQGASSANYQSTGMAGYPQSHSMSYLPYQNPHAPYQSHMTGPIDYSVHPTNPPPTGPYHPSASSHYPGQIHHGYSHPSDPYMQQTYSQGPYDYDQTGQIGGICYSTPSTIPLSQDPIGQIGSNGQSLQGPGPYATYPGQLPPPSHYQQNLGLDPNTQQPYGQYHPHHSAHHHPGAAFGTTPGQTIDQNYMAFGQQSQYHGPPGNGFIPFGQPLSNGQLHHQNPYGLIQNQNQIGIIDSSNQTRPPQSSIGKASIKNEEQAMENELHLLNSLGDSQSQQEDKIKQGGSNYLIPSQYDQQPPYPYYLSSQSYGIQKKDDLMSQNQYFQGYPQYPTGQYPSSSQQSIPSLQNAASSTSIKDKDDPSKRQPNSPGRRKTIKKSSPTGNTEPSSPASPRGRKRKNTAKLDQPQPESTQNLNQGIINQQQQQQFGLHLVKVSNQDQQKNMGYPGQPYYQPVNALGKVMIDPNTQHISGIDQNSLQRLKELPTDFNMNEFTAVYDDQKQIGSISKEERKQKIKNYQDKRKRRSWQKKISYDVRKKVADGRLRVKGRFVTKKQAMEMLSINGKEEDYTMDQLKEMLKQQGIQANGGEEDSKSPTLPKKKNQSQPGTIVSLKPGDDDEEEGYGSGGEVHSEELPPSEVLPIIRGKSCENIPNKDEFFQGQGDFNYQNMVQGSLANNNTSNNNSLNENQLHLKLEQKEIENKQFQQNPQQFQQLQNQQSYSSKTQSQSQSPVRSPKKQNNSGVFQNSNNNIKFMEQNQGHQIQSINQIETSNNIKNVNGHSSYADQKNGESPQHSQNNILSQEMADQFGNLNIKSPDQKQKIMQQKNNPQMLNLSQTQQEFFGNNQVSQNYNLYNQQQYNGNNNGYAIHQQQ
ncbi:hypothetical protein ABPG72_016626 [Tetrahymena utriculariae]